MSYELSFRKPIAVPDDDIYFNDCCYGGDVVSQRLLPTIRERYGAVRANQEDWGWFVWFDDRSASLAVDIFCDDRENGRYRIHLTSRRRKWFFLNSVVDVPELEDLKTLVMKLFDGWADGPCHSEHF